MAASRRQYAATVVAYRQEKGNDVQAHSEQTIFA
jgi:hypothetical protein